MAKKWMNVSVKAGCTGIQVKEQLVIAIIQILYFSPFLKDPAYDSHCVLL